MSLSIITLSIDIESVFGRKEKMKIYIETKSAPAAIGTYSQAVRMGNVVYLSGQIGLRPESAVLVEGIEQQVRQMFENLQAVTEAAGGTLGDVVKLNIYLTDMSNFSLVNEVMADYFVQPYPARAAVGVSQLPKGALVEADGIMHIQD